MALPTRITLPPSGRPVGGLLSAARPIGGQWWRGVTFASGQCLVPQTVGTCTDGATTKNMDALSEAASFDAFGVVQALACSTLGRSAIDEFAGQSLDVTREFAMAREFLTGAASSNPSLADATVLGTSAADAVAALACLDQHASTQLSGRLVFIHASPQLATTLLAGNALWRDGRTWRTALGNVVVVSAGYDGRSPGGGAPTDGDPLYMYATGEVYAEVGQREVLQSVERGQNTLESVAEDAALVAFDPCFNVAVDTTEPYCDLTPLS